MHDTILLEDGGQLGQALRCGVGARMLVNSKVLITLLALDHNRANFSIVHTGRVRCQNLF